MLEANLLSAYSWVEWAIYVAIAIAGVVGAVLAASVRDDAYDAAGRQGKWIWVGILAVSALVTYTRFPFLSWVGMVAIGIYWFDVRPQIKDILQGNYGW